MDYQNLFNTLNQQKEEQGADILTPHLESCCIAPKIIIDDIKYIEVCENCGVFKVILKQEVNYEHTLDKNVKLYIYSNDKKLSSMKRLVMWLNNSNIDNMFRKDLDIIKSIIGDDKIVYNKAEYFYKYFYNEYREDNELTKSKSIIKNNEAIIKKSDKLTLRRGIRISLMLFCIYKATKKYYPEVNIYDIIENRVSISNWNSMIKNIIFDDDKIYLIDFDKQYIIDLINSQYGLNLMISNIELLKQYNLIINNHNNKKTALIISLFLILKDQIKDIKLFCKILNISHNSFNNNISKYL